MKLQKAFKIILPILFLLAILALPGIFFENENSVSPLELGEQLPAYKLKNEQGQDIEMPGESWYLLLLTKDIQSNFSFLRYTEKLVRDKFGGRTLSIAVFSGMIDNMEQDIGYHRPWNLSFYPVRENSIYYHEQQCWCQIKSYL